MTYKGYQTRNIIENYGNTTLYAENSGEIYAAILSISNSFAISLSIASPSLLRFMNLSPFLMAVVFRDDIDKATLDIVQEDNRNIAIVLNAGSQIFI